jgi:hypothetical protein
MAKNLTSEQIDPELKDWFINLVSRIFVIRWQIENNKPITFGPYSEESWIARSLFSTGWDQELLSSCLELSEKGGFVNKESIKTLFTDLLDGKPFDATSATPGVTCPDVTICQAFCEKLDEMLTQK